MKLKKWLKYSLIILITGLVLLNILAARHAWMFTHVYPAAKPHHSPQQLTFGEKALVIFTGIKSPKPKLSSGLSIPHDTITLTTKNNLSIEGWYAKKDSAKGAVALFHGHLASKSAVVAEAEAFYSLGYSVFLIDFRAHGNSGGTTCTIGYKEAEEVKLALDFLTQKEKNNIILWGVSMGAAAITSAFEHFAISPSAVILELPFGNLHHTVAVRVKMMGLPAEPVAALLTFWGGVENGFNGFSYSPTSYAKRINCPVLLQSGLLDEKVSQAEINSIFSTISSTKKQQVVYEESGHQSLLVHEPDKWNAAVSGFLNTIP